MKYKLSKYQLFNIFCNDRECETCKYHKRNCTEEFYKDMDSEYNEFKMED